MMPYDVNRLTRRDLLLSLVEMKKRIHRHSTPSDKGTLTQAIIRIKEDEVRIVGQSAAIARLMAARPNATPIGGYDDGQRRPD